ncbi:class I SAM-dependent methyltransferase [Populibacterium corticicola]|uniref:Class I SAM-dependent methyltransferase n=1 Tax=Populibacterium corticicola TaxID=1812826 RepID=A0ABW5XH68_9MICO
MEQLDNENVDITWEDARDANLANWNERVAIHVEAYGLNAFRDDPHHISGVVAHDRPYIERHLGHTIDGLDLAHLQCHIGTDTLSFARLGAQVTGVDFSQPALDAAEALAQELNLPATWVQGDVLESARLVGKQFDVVYTSIGAIGWLKDLGQWAQQVAALLRDGGLFYIRDGHPSLYALDDQTFPPVVRYRYFENGHAQSWDSDETYTGGGTITSTRTYEFPHSTAEVINSLIAAGLTIEAFYEGDTLPWEFSKEMERLPDGSFAWPGALRAAVPCTFTVVARKN